MHNTAKQYIVEKFINHLNDLRMHDLKTNFDKFFELVSNRFKDEISIDGNFRFYSNMPKLSDTQIIALSLCQESLGIDSENHYWSKLKKDYIADFPRLIHLTRFNIRKKVLTPYIDRFNKSLANELNEGENTYIVDSMPIPICKISREKRIKACCEKVETAPDKGYSSAIKQYFIGYKLHLVISYNGVFQSMDITKASIHDIHYLSDIKYGGLNNCLLLADKGYLSGEYQIDLFNYAKIQIETPKKSNQKDFENYPFIFKKSRKRVETLFSQLCDQFMLKRNYAKSFPGLRTRIICKLTAVTALQYFNKCNGLPLNHIKHALAA